MVKQCVKRIIAWVTPPLTPLLALYSCPALFPPLPLPHTHLPKNLDTLSPLNGWGVQLSCGHVDCSPHPHPNKKINPGFGFFVKVHLLVSLKLELYDLYFRNYSYIIIMGEIHIVLNTIQCVDGF